MASVIIKDLSKLFGEVKAVDRITFTAEDGEITTLLGPSGCGKTTTIKVIAGLENPNTGEVRIGDELICSASPAYGLPPEKRQIGMVFQSYAVWPHMTVHENLAFPLKLRKVSKKEIQDRVKRTLALLEIDKLDRRYPAELSGGQQQRVALARALIYDPKILLLDEPLANLDAKIRERVRFELKEVQRKTGVTTIYVTHDQAEAMVLSDKLIVMNQGAIMQEGSAFETYNSPSNSFVAGFIGLSNTIPSTISQIEPEVLLETEDGVTITYRVGDMKHRALPPEVKVGTRVLLFIRPEDIEVRLERPKDSVNVLEGKFERMAYLGNINDLYVRCGNRSLRIQFDAYLSVQEGDAILLYFDPEKIKIITEQ